MSAPILYSFRRCPYAMRARLALHASGITVELREILLRDKPASLLLASPKGSVPVLQLADGTVIDESWDIMRWALRQHDPQNWLGSNNCHLEATAPLLSENDTRFKRQLDRYKYADRHPEHPSHYYRVQGELFLQQLENRLGAHHYLLGEHFSVADAALLPFVRQFAGVDTNWFSASPYPQLRHWLENFLRSERFHTIMHKYPLWQAENPPVFMHNRGEAQ